MFIYLIALVGLARYIPGVNSFLNFVGRHSGGTGGTGSARYCYSVWLRHLVMAYENGLPTQPDVVAELGPGYSIGVGLASLISGAGKYYGLDVVDYSTNKRNIEIFDELVDLFKQQEDIPNESEFPMLEPYLKSYKFPSHILTEQHLSESLNKDRITSIRNSVIQIGNKEHNSIQYMCPWFDAKVIKRESVDMIFSQDVLEHVENLENTYKAQSLWLKPNGFMSHTIDFRSHMPSRWWNGNWRYSDFVWAMIRGNRSYLLNRQPYSAHIKLLGDCGFKIICEVKIKDTTGIPRDRLASKWRNMTEDDLTCCSAFIQAVKV